MDYQQTAKRVLELVGGRENIITAAHCATRLRLVLHDESKVDQAALEDLDGVSGAFSSSGQYQIIFGTGTVNKVFAAFAPLAGVKVDGEEPLDVKKAASQKLNPFARLARSLSNVFVPLIPAIVAAGLLMGLLGMIKAFGWVEGDSPIVQLLDMFSSSAFIILPILIGFSAAREFGANPYLGAVIGGIMTHPSLLNPWTLGNSDPEVMKFLGMNIELIGYQGTVFPVLLTVWVMAKIEQQVRKRTPETLDLLVTPFVTVLVTGFLALIVIGPIGTLLGKGISFVLVFFYEQFSVVAGLLFGGLYSTIVITGMHHSFHAIEAGLLADKSIGKNFLLPIWSMANVAQGGAGLAVYFLTKNVKLKALALPSAFSAFLGITEPVIYGVNLRLGKPFIGGAIGGAIGGGYVVLTQVAANAYGLTGIPMIAIVAPLGATNLINYLVGFAIAVVTAFVSTVVLMRLDARKQKETDIAA
ncbi:sucrose-specific PTS transporter subunit IIBC [Exiguobacterium acetylicum]|uniref:sucrose-specific PTS transporter subunit IIBC n=1 Tax=Exiguobacterium TaxID=33986 RepID=UPI0004498EC9|nr:MULTISPECIES: sucrose-specific PTS transporter subunit IIBC [Exiguobacterium]EZP59000.1 PTS system, sucrose-specific IIBC subunit [Exiguobacterium sp. RIT341]MDQ6468415.1 sucrose-specific PTS transporter subunit IIBC [Exiguobacterium acetylicum]